MAHEHVGGPTALLRPLQYVPGGSIQSLLLKFGKFEDSVISAYTDQVPIPFPGALTYRTQHPSSGPRPPARRKTCCLFSPSIE